MRVRKIFIFVIFIVSIIISSICPGMTLIEKYKDIKVGDWVKLEVSNGTKQLLFVADKDDKSITIEIKEYDRGFVVSWRQLVIDIPEKKTVLIREKDPVSGKIIERKPLEGESVDDVLQARFDKKGDEKLRHTLQVPSDDGKRLIEKRMTFDCEVYKTVLEDRFVEIWYSKEIPLYPLKANIPGLNTTIKLVRYGSGWESRFLPPEKDDNPEG